MTARVAILSIGDELIEGRHVDRNAATLSAALLEAGLHTVEHATVADGLEPLVAAIRRLASKADLVISTGGLGPTLDDLTRQAAADAAGVELVRDAAAQAALEARFRDMGREMAPSNLRQADFPRGAQVLANQRGTAPGFAIQLPAEAAPLGERPGAGALFVALPGPPREVGPMIEAELLPLCLVYGLLSKPPARRSYFLHAKSESVFAQAVHEAGGWMERDADPSMGVTASQGLLAVQLTATSREPASIERLNQRVRAFQELFGDAIYSEHEKDPSKLLVEELLARRISVSLAESCTGGLVAAALTDHAGVSAVLDRTWVTYSNAAKRDELGVPAELLEAHGAVSSEVVEAMARGAAERSGARLALAISGIAGPSGGSDEKPLGLVWFGLAIDGVATSFARHFPPIDRRAIRTWALNTALITLLRATRSL